MDAETIAELHTWRKSIRGCSCIIEQVFSLQFARVGPLCPHCTELDKMLVSLKAFQTEHAQPVSGKASRRGKKSSKTG